MATRRTVDLGTVGFGLVPNTTELDRSLAQLRKFGKEVERLGTHTEDAVQKQYRKFAQIERILSTLFARTSATTQKMKETGVAAVEIDKVNRAYLRLNTTLTKNADAMTRAQTARGVVGMSAILSRGNRLAASAEVNKTVLAFRDLERAAILAVGPLSGIGARLAVMAALFESTSASMALFIATTTGVVVGLGMAATAGVKASMDMERFDAQLIASTGSAALTGDAYQYVLNIAQRLGHNVRDLVEPFAKFTTAARLSNVPMEQQRKIFEAAVVAGTSMRLNGERMKLVFLALEQMLSKGTVTMEELRRQLGDLLPGSFEMAAKAMNVTGGELAKMIKNGEVLAKDLLPKLAESWVETFGPSAEQAAKSLQSEHQRLGTSTFELAKAFDAATGASGAWRSIVVTTREVLDIMRAHIDKVIAALGALAGAGAGLAALALFTRLPAAITATVRAVRTLTAAVLALDLALIATGWGAIAKTLLRVGVAAAGAVAGYHLLNREVESSTRAVDDWTVKAEDWLRIQKDIGRSHEQTTEMMIQGTATRLRAVYAEIEGEELRLRALNVAHEKQKKSLEGLSQKPSFAVPFAGMFNMAPASEDPEVKAQQEKVDALNDLRKRLESTIEGIQNLSVEKSRGGGEDPSSQWQTWAEKLAQSLRTVKSLDDQIRAAEFGTTAMKQAEAMGKAIEFMADQPEKGRGNVIALSRALNEAGFEGKNLTEQLAKMFAAIEEKQQTIKDIEALPGKVATAGEAIRKMFETMEARKTAALFGDPGDAADKQMEIQTAALKRHLDVLVRMGLTQEQVNFLVEQFRSQWKDMADAEEGSKEIKKLTADLERLNEQLGDKGERAIKEFEARMQLAMRGLITGVIPTYEEYAALVIDIQEDMQRKIIDKTSLFGRSIKQMFRDVERGSAEILAQMTMGQKIGWKEMFNNILNEALTFFYKMTVIQPLMKGLFGGLYTEKSNDMGTGLLETGIRSFLGMNNTPITNGMAGLATDLSYGGGVDAWMGMNARGGSHMVGGVGGTDSQLVAFRATPNERVDILTPEQQRMGGGGNMAVKVIVKNETGVAAEAHQGAVTFDSEGAVVELLFRRLKRDAGARDRLSSMMKAPY